MAQTPLIPPPTTRNDGLRAAMLVDDVYANGLGNTGAGVNVGIWDEGSIGTHLDLQR